MKSDTLATSPFWSGQLINKTALVRMICAVSQKAGKARLAALLMLDSAQACYFFRSFRISRAAFAPEPPVKPAPGCVPLPHRYRFAIGVR